MSASTIERLSDEQLDNWRKTGVPAISVPLLLADAIAIRAERAKPTQSDEERAWAIWKDSEDFIGDLLAAFASIRAEGSAERAKLEADLEYRTSQRDNLYSRVAELDRALTAVRGEHAKLEAALNGAYRERNAVVAALAKCFPSGVKKTAIDGWDEAWHNCVYIDLPTGQASWHFHDNDAKLFEGLPPYQGYWDGHTTSDKYDRLATLAQPAESGVTEKQIPDHLWAKDNFDV